MARSKWKLIYFSNSFWRKIKFLKTKKRVKRRIFYDRASSIPRSFLLHVLRIHKGKKYRRLIVTLFNIKKKLGEFSYTRKPFHFPPKKTKKKKNLIRR